ncbi:50S ribosomal protein L29 [Bacteriovoracaceae bacterium]|nr:50S ribosomal protein L29 [Bacteriovoracaceae bacterium]|tara:strand:+ start:4883 stop:5077 length:195 start_codon:yes stop_codon:yes gene_type:complete
MVDVLKYSDVKGLDKAAIDAKIADSRKQLFDIRIQKTTSGVEKPHVIKDIKKNIAKLLTAKNQK